MCLHLSSRTWYLANALCIQWAVWAELYPILDKFPRWDEHIAQSAMPLDLCVCLMNLNLVAMNNILLLTMTKANQLCEMQIYKSQEGKDCKQGKKQQTLLSIQLESCLSTNVRRVEMVNTNKSAEKVVTISCSLCVPVRILALYYVVSLVGNVCDISQACHNFCPVWKNPKKICPCPTVDKISH